MIQSPTVGRDHLSNSNDSQNHMPSYIIFWIGQLASILGSNIVQFGIIWWLTIITNSAFMLGLGAFLGFGSQMVLTPFAGVFVDRWSRKKVIAIADGLQATVTLILILLFATGIETNIPLLGPPILVVAVLVIMTLRGCFAAFHGPAVQAIIPLMVPEDQLSRINALNYLANSMVFIVGPPIGAFAYSFFQGNMALILWIDAITFLVAIVPVILIHIPSPKKQDVVQEKRPFKEDFSEGFKFIRETRGLLTLLSAFTAANFFLTPFGVLLPLFVTQQLAFGDENLGAAILAGLMFFQNGSMLSASILMTAWKGFKRNVIGVALGLFLGGTGIVIISLTPPGGVLITILGILVWGLTVPIANVSSQTIWQKVVPPEKLGRVYSVRVFFAQGSAPISMLGAGIVAQLIGVPPVLFLCGGLLILILVYAVLFTGFRDVEKTINASQMLSVQERVESHV